VVEEKALEELDLNRHENTIPICPEPQAIVLYPELEEIGLRKDTRSGAFNVN